MIICIDFDQTIVKTTGDYNIVGLRKHAKQVINKWMNRGHYIIINTLRQGEYLSEARKFLQDNFIRYNRMNANMPLMEKIWGPSPNKIGADVYIDDRNIVPVVNWWVIDKLLYVWERKVAKRQRKPRILCIIGESGVGKTTVSNYIEQRYGIHAIKSYTDRPRRFDGENGHIFLTGKQFNNIYVDDMIAFTTFGGYRYCCKKDDVDKTNTYVIDEDGLRMLKYKYGSVYDIVSLRLRCSPHELYRRSDVQRRARDKGRFTMQDNDFDFVIDTTMPKIVTRQIIDHFMREFVNFR